jgi:hypothetical protein
VALEDNFEVTIRYRERLFASRAGLPVRTYQTVFRVRAADEEEANQRGRAEFEHLRLVSSVGWPRTIVDVRCRPLG